MEKKDARARPGTRVTAYLPAEVFKLLEDVRWAKRQSRSKVISDAIVSFAKPGASGVPADATVRGMREPSDGAGASPDARGAKGAGVEDPR